MKKAIFYLALIPLSPIIGLSVALYGIGSELFPESELFKCPGYHSSFDEKCDSCNMNRRKAQPKEK